jgi:hypothetical protein
MMLEQSKMSLRKFQCLLTALVLALLIGCSSTGSLTTQKLDPLTAVTITFTESPLVFYHDQSGRAAHARDYIHMAPLEVNRGGTYRYFVWLGIWNTQQDSQTGGPRDGFESVVVIADGEPKVLELSGWTAASVGASEPIYLKPVASSSDAYYEVTADYLRLLAESKDIRIRSSGARGASYEPWDNQEGALTSLREFVRDVRY